MLIPVLVSSRLFFVNDAAKTSSYTYIDTLFALVALPMTEPEVVPARLSAKRPPDVGRSRAARCGAVADRMSKHDHGVALDRHCERSEAIESGLRDAGLPRRFAPRNDESLMSESTYFSSTSSSAMLGCSATVAAKSALVSPAFTATPPACRIYGASGPIM